MGAGASIEGDEPVDKAKAEILAGGAWVNMEAKFDAEASEEGFVSAQRCRELLAGDAAGAEEKEAVALSANESFCTETDVQDDGVQAMMRMLDGVPQLAERNIDDLIRSQSHEEGWLDARHAARRARIAKEAEEMLAKFEAMGPAEKKRAVNNGDMDHYSHENQMLREALFDENVEVNAQLDLWWKAAETYIDGDKNDMLTAEEYSVFHRRLLKIAVASLENASSFKEDSTAAEEEVEEMSEGEIDELMKQDFKADAGEDGAVSKEEFRFAVFEMADHWTCSVDAEEYVDFLKVGYKIVFDDMIAADKIMLPSSWAKELKRVKGITPMPVNRAADLMSGILNEKIKADKVDKQKGTPQQTMEEFVLDYFKLKNGAGKASQKVLKTFCLSLLALVEDPKQELHEYGVLFAQMCGVSTPSGRITALPHSCSSFLLSHLDGARDILRETGKKQQAVKKKAAEVAAAAAGAGSGAVSSSNSGGGGGGGKEGKSGGGGIDSRSKDLISGMLDLNAISAYLSKVLTTELGLAYTAPLFRVAMVSIRSLAIDVVPTPAAAAGAGAAGGDIRAPKKVVQCMKFAVLLAVVFAAWEETGGAKGNHGAKGAP